MNERMSGSEPSHGLPYNNYCARRYSHFLQIFQGVRGPVRGAVIETESGIIVSSQREGTSRAFVFALIAKGFAAKF